MLDEGLQQLGATLQCERALRIVAQEGGERRRRGEQQQVVRVVAEAEDPCLGASSSRSNWGTRIRSVRSAAAIASRSIASSAAASRGDLDLGAAVDEELVAERLRFSHGRSFPRSSAQPRRDRASHSPRRRPGGASTCAAACPPECRRPPRRGGTRRSTRPSETLADHVDRVVAGRQHRLAVADAPPEPAVVLSRGELDRSAEPPAEQEARPLERQVPDRGALTGRRAAWSRSSWSPPPGENGFGKMNSDAPPGLPSGGTRAAGRPASPRIGDASGREHLGGVVRATGAAAGQPEVHPRVQHGVRAHRGPGCAGLERGRRPRCGTRCCPRTRCRPVHARAPRRQRAASGGS